MDKLLKPFLKLAGVALVLLGLLGAYYGPLEIYVFYLFSEGGRFYYDGFGVGSLWFAYLVIQNLGYYIVAAIALPLGIGHLRGRRWTLTLVRVYAWFWLGSGLLLLGNFVAWLPTILRLDFDRTVWLPRLGIIATVLPLILVLLPVFVLWFYNRPSVRVAFDEPGRAPYWIERYPFPLLIMLLLDLIVIGGLHVAVFFQALFPLFGEIMLGRPAVYVIAGCVVIVGVLIYGTVRLRPWAWWGSVVFYAAMAISSILTFSRYTVIEIVTQLQPPAFELEFVDRLAFIHDFHLAGLIGVPLLVLLGLIITSKRYFVISE